MAGWNETTREILRVLSKSQKSTDELAEDLDCSRSNITVPLLKLFRRGCVDRKSVQVGEVVLRNPDGVLKKQIRRRIMVYVYRITESGRGRLKHLEASGL